MTANLVLWPEGHPWGVWRGHAGEALAPSSRSLGTGGCFLWALCLAQTITILSRVCSSREQVRQMKKLEPYSGFTKPWAPAQKGPLRESHVQPTALEHLSYQVSFKSVGFRRAEEHGSGRRRVNVPQKIKVPQAIPNPDKNLNPNSTLKAASSPQFFYSMNGFTICPSLKLEASQSGWGSPVSRPPFLISCQDLSVVSPWHLFFLPLPLHSICRHPNSDPHWLLLGLLKWPHNWSSHLPSLCCSSHTPDCGIDIQIAQLQFCHIPAWKTSVSLLFLQK